MGTSTRALLLALHCARPCAAALTSILRCQHGAVAIAVFPAGMVSRAAVGSSSCSGRAPARLVRRQ